MLAIDSYSNIAAEVLDEAETLSLGMGLAEIGRWQVTFMGIGFGLVMRTRGRISGSLSALQKQYLNSLAKNMLRIVKRFVDKSYTCGRDVLMNVRRDVDGYDGGSSDG